MTRAGEHFTRLPRTQVALDCTLSQSARCCIAATSAFTAERVVNVNRRTTLTSKSVMPATTVSVESLRIASCTSSAKRQPFANGSTSLSRNCRFCSSSRPAVCAIRSISTSVLQARRRAKSRLILLRSTAATALFCNSKAARFQARSAVLSACSHA